MNKFCSTLIGSVMLMPAAAYADPTFGAQLVLGYGEVEGEGDSYAIVTSTVTDTHVFDSGVELTWNLRARGRTDRDDLGALDADNIDASLEADFGAAGKVGLTTFAQPVHDFPWADGELFNRGSIGVMPVIRKRYDGVADSQFDRPFNKVDPDLLLTYSNRFGPVAFDLVANPLGTWNGTDEDDLISGPVPLIEGKLTLPTDYGIYSIAVNDLHDAELQAVYPMRDIGLTLIARHSINEGDWTDSRTNLAAMYRAKNMGIFKGAMLAYATDDTADRAMLGLTFGYEALSVKVAGDTDGDMAIEGDYAFSDATSFMFGWDNGHDAMEGFNDAAFPAPVFAPARGSAFEVALVHNF